jgi:hypothetical protein
MGKVQRGLAKEHLIIKAPCLKLIEVKLCYIKELKLLCPIQVSNWRVAKISI